MAEFFVSTSGSDANLGTSAKPFLTITRGVNELKAGDILTLREGNYVESVLIKEKHGSLRRPIVIRSKEGEHATIDGSVLQFRSDNNNDWEPASRHDSNAVKDEFVSCDTFPLDSPEDNVNRGAFLDREPYTRLITYSRLEDLRAENQTFDNLKPDDTRFKLLLGPEVTDEAGNGKGFKRPWVYMGPGLFFNQTSGRIHIRLSHTNNNIPGLADYNGLTNPGKVGLAISHKARRTLLIENSSFVCFKNLSIRFGGNETLRIRKTTSVVFDHVRILAASHGVAFEGNTGTVFRHCEIHGGLPGWYFRSDRKAEYFFKEGDKVVKNLLGKQTSEAIIFGGEKNTGVVIHNCEFLDAHDLYLFGQNTQFHHNWINNLNDEGLVLDATETSNLKIYRNVITQCLSAISFAGVHFGGPKYIYRNLIDLRRPTAGFRPTSPDDKDVFRFGHLYKSGEKGADGPFAFFQNTCLVIRQKSPSYSHYEATGSTHPRHSFNNIFVAINPSPDFDHAITFLPPPSFPGPTDGNCYFRIGHAEAHLFRFRAYKFQNEPEKKAGTFKDLKSLRGDPLAKPPLPPSGAS